MDSKIVEMVKEAAKSYNAIGLRSVDSVPSEIGFAIPASYEWDMENDVSCYETTGEKLNGTCAIQIFADDFEDDEEVAQAIENAIETVKSYGGERVILVGGDEWEYGNDSSEIIVRDTCSEGAIYCGEIK